MNNKIRGREGIGGVLQKGRELSFEKDGDHQKKG